MPSCTHPIYKLRNPQPIRNEAGIIVGAEGPCRCGENWTRAFFAGQAGDYTRKRDAHMSESGGGSRALHGNGSVSDVMPDNTDSNRTGSIKPDPDS